MLKAKTQSDAATGNNKLADSEAGAKPERITYPITDKRGYGTRWGLCVRSVDNLLRQGLPHIKVGARRVRINVDEADAWMKQRYGTQRRSPVQRGGGQ